MTIEVDRVDRLNQGLAPYVFQDGSRLDPLKLLPGVRFLYAVPADRQYSAAAAQGIRDAVLHFQSRLRDQTGGYTFAVRGICLRSV